MCLGLKMYFLQYWVIFFFLLNKPILAGHLLYAMVYAGASGGGPFLTTCFDMSAVPWCFSSIREKKEKKGALETEVKRRQPKSPLRLGGAANFWGTEMGNENLLGCLTSGGDGEPLAHQPHVQPLSTKTAKCSLLSSSSCFWRQLEQEDEEPVAFDVYKCGILMVWNPKPTSMHNHQCNDDSTFP